MSISPSRLRRVIGQRLQGAEGFTLVEILVALLLIALVSIALVPLLASGLKASRLTKLETEARNLTVARVDAMRALPYHVAYQNGPFVDLLDEYYTNASTTSLSISATGGTGKYVQAGTIPGQSATSNYYQVSFGSPPEPSGFTQAVYSQFVAPNTETTSSTGDSVITPASTYNSQATGTDSPPSLVLAVTVVTSFQTAGHTHTNSAYTEITDTGHDSPLVVAQAGGEAVNISSVASDGTDLSGDLTEVGVNGSLANESTASASVLGGSFTRVDPTGAGTSDSSTTGVSPPPAVSPTTSSYAGTAGVGGSTGASTCTWNYLGPTSDSNVTSTVSSAQPRAPYDVESASDSVKVMLNSDGLGSCTSNSFSFSNVVNATDVTNTAMGLPANGAMVSIPDATPAGNPLVTASGKMDTPALAFSSSGQITNPVTTSASITYAEPVILFPGLGFVTASSVSCGTSCSVPTENGLVVVDLTSVQVSCSSQATATGQYSGTVYVWEQSSATATPGYVAYPFSYTSTSASLPSLPALSTPVGYTTSGSAVPLSTYISSWSAGSLVQEASGSDGDHTIPGALTVATQPTLVSAGSLLSSSAIDLQIGRVSCVSEDNR